VGYLRVNWNSDDVQRVDTSSNPPPYSEKSAGN
jgi:hypothetical protein